MGGGRNRSLDFPASFVASTRSIALPPGQTNPPSPPLGTGLVFCSCVLEAKREAIGATAMIRELEGIDTEITAEDRDSEEGGNTSTWDPTKYGTSRIPKEHYTGRHLAASKEGTSAMSSVHGGETKGVA